MNSHQLTEMYSRVKAFREKYEPHQLTVGGLLNSDSVYLCISVYICVIIDLVLNMFGVVSMIQWLVKIHVFDTQMCLACIHACICHVFLSIR